MPIRMIQLIVGEKAARSLRYFHQRGRFPNLKNPRDLSEKIMASMLSPSFARYAPYADKVKVRDYIRERGLEDILLEHYGVWERPEEIDFASLPDKFILKTNNGCGGHVICKDKSQLDIPAAVKTLNKALNKGVHSIERHYRAIEPRVFAEELLDTGTDQWPTDYKIQCFRGRPDHFFVGVERSFRAKFCTFDLDWNQLPYTKPEYMPQEMPVRPDHIERMLEIAEKLSEGFDCVRVDLYEWKGSVYFSELTFSSWGGLMYSYTDEAIKLLGTKF